MEIFSFHKIRGLLISCTEQQKLFMFKKFLTFHDCVSFIELQGE